MIVIIIVAVVINISIIALYLNLVKIQISDKINYKTNSLHCGFDNCRSIYTKRNKNNKVNIG